MNLKTTFLAVVSTLLMASCATDPCMDVTCLNASTCSDGTCLCTDWYEGTDCGTEQRTKFLGTYSGAVVFAQSGGSPDNENWDIIKKKSEKIAKFSGTEEMRCDWFLAPSGSEVKKKCILNEIAYIGGFDRLSKPMQHKYVKCVVDGFLRNKGEQTDNFDVLYK